MNLTLRHFCLTMLLLSLASGSLTSQSIQKDHLLRSSYLQETRLISVSVPANYELSTQSYPTVYLLDGEYIFGYAKGAVDFLSNDFGFLPEMIVVSIPNTNRTRDLFVTMNEEDGFFRFTQFLTLEVLPFIQDNYRVNDFNIIYGWSSGSSIGTYLIATQPEVFDGYILSGNGIGPRSSAFLKDQLQNHTLTKPTYLYACTEDEDLRRPGLQRFENLIDSLNPENLFYQFEIPEESSHVSVLATGLYAGLEFIFADFYIPQEVIMQGSASILEYYRAIDHKYNFEVQIPEGAINESASFLFHSDKKEDALELLKFGMNLYPHSATLHGSAGEIHQADSSKALAKEHYRIAMELSSNNLADYLKYQTLLHELEQ